MEKDFLQYIIVIIVAVIWVISKVSKATKTNTSTTPPPINPERNKDFEEWWKELSQEIEAQATPEPASAMVMQQAEHQPIDKVNANYFDNLHKNYKNAEFTLTHKPLQKLEIINDFDNTDIGETHKPLNINLRHNDEIRRAFVYSEIFNRKYLI
jgi:hypothetical protein